MKLSLATSLLITVSTANAFSVNVPSVRVSQHQYNGIMRSSAGRTIKSTTRISAIIYGWDDADDDDDGPSSTKYLPYEDAGPSEFDMKACTTAGSDVAESLMRPDRMGVLARLAVAFSPPQQALNLDDIEQIHVTCVRDNQLDLEAILCENHGCVSLSIPIQFPQACSSQDWLEGCVMSNLDALDAQAEIRLLEQNQMAAANAPQDLEELCLLNQKVDYPSWWVPPECDAALAGECDAIKLLLNENDFAASMVALAQDGLEHANQSHYSVQQAKVAAVGPAGICMKVGATSPTQSGMIYMDVVYPFGGNPVQDVDALHAVVLGAVASAEEKRPSHVYEQR